MKEFTYRAQLKPVTEGIHVTAKIGTREDPINTEQQGTQI